jgi:hypothetical protein
LFTEEEDPKKSLERDMSLDKVQEQTNSIPNYFNQTFSSPEELDKAIKRVPQLSNDELINRFRFHPAKDELTKKSHEWVRNACLELAAGLNSAVPDGREKALALTKLEEVMMWANAGIARNS